MTHIDPKTAGIDRLASLMTDEFIAGTRHNYQNSKWGNELRRRGPDVIPGIGNYLKTQEERISNFLVIGGNREEVEQGWIMFLNVMAINHIIIVPALNNFKEWVKWADTFDP